MPITTWRDLPHLGSLRNGKICETDSTYGVYILGSRAGAPPAMTRAGDRYPLVCWSAASSTSHVMPRGALVGHPEIYTLYTYSVSETTSPPKRFTSQPDHCLISERQQ
ncbi:hypothetical protein Y032_0656g1231 [Ancylostoma ceylanicum]|nr:hypothetical protein Y032_0656g1231 [Ancylostoma ceylanicum]